MPQQFMTTGDVTQAQQQIENLYATLLHIFERSQAANRAHP